MTVIGIDDTDSQTEGMCTTFVATRLAERLTAAGMTVSRSVLVRLNPAVEHKTRGNAALAVHTDSPPGPALEHLETVLERARVGDDRTDPGGIVLPTAPEAVPKPLVGHARRALRDIVPLEDARELVSRTDARVATGGDGRGLIGALAAVGAWRAFDEWTYECLVYREQDRWGTDRTVERDSVFTAATRAYPAVWDTVDRPEETAVCVPRTPCPVLYGIRGETPETVERVASEIKSEPVARRRTFVTNQGTDAHLSEATISSVEDGRSYRVTGTVTAPPETRTGGHVFVEIGDGESRLQCVAFEPTKRFRDWVRALKPADRVTVCGEVADGTLKLEKFAVRELVRTESVTPTCPRCECRMESAGANQGYRCRSCGTDAPSKQREHVDRALSIGWYEVPPVARRHLARPLVRGGFDAPVHPATE